MLRLCACPLEVGWRFFAIDEFGASHIYLERSLRPKSEHYAAVPVAASFQDDLCRQFSLEQGAAVHVQFENLKLSWQLHENMVKSGSVQDTHEGIGFSCSFYTWFVGFQNSISQ